MRLKVRIKNPIWYLRHTYAHNVMIEEYNDYDGEIVRKSWMNKDQFGITTGNPESPIRILEKDMIICGWKLD